VAHALSGSATTALRAAQYVRMSTEHQSYSPENQSEAIAKYARSRQIEIVRTYADLGRSGLSLTGRHGLRALLNDVSNSLHDFSLLLVYDVSRWGRFQDADESAYYEYFLKRAGVQVHYCAEQFVNDGSLASVIAKTLKRAMAGEYSRELSVKTFAGQSRLVELGFHLGGPPGYGFRRQLVDKDGLPKGSLERQQKKNINSDRVILIPGPASELDTIATIYRSFISLKKTETGIAAALNGQGIKTHLGRAWTRGIVHEILTNPKYIGVNVFNRVSSKLKSKKVRNPSSMWIQKDHAFGPIVSTEDFHRAQAIIQHRHIRWTDKQMLDGLRNLLTSFGKLSSPIIDQALYMPCSFSYATRFGGLARAYSLIGWRGKSDPKAIEAKRGRKGHYDSIRASILNEIKSSGATIRNSGQNGHLMINEEFSICIRMANCRHRKHSREWAVDFAKSTPADVSILVRLGADNETILDYFVLPLAELLGKTIRILEHNQLALDIYRFDNLDFFFELCKKTTIGDIT
jgi:DNA invertase Pin-like site-specific DNA recombinase